MSNFISTITFKWIDPKEFDLNKYASNSSKECGSWIFRGITRITQ